MKTKVIILFAGFIFQIAAPAVAQSTQDFPDSGTYFKQISKRPVKKRNDAAKIEALIRRMTVEEKVGQMTQLTIDMVTSDDDQEVRIDPAKLEKAISKYGVGSILNVNNQALPMDRWHEIISGIQTAAARTRLKIPVIYGIDSIHGANYIQGATLFPQEIGMAATWNPGLMQRAAEITAAETRAAGIPWSFSPVLDIGRYPIWPRFWETFGEDPYLAKVMGTAFVRGLEGEGVGSGKSVASSLKHYAGYSFPLNGRDRTPAWIPEHYMREYFLPPVAARAAPVTGLIVESIFYIPGVGNGHFFPRGVAQVRPGVARIVSRRKAPIIVDQVVYPRPRAAGFLGLDPEYESKKKESGEKQACTFIHRARSR
jgi:beta-glucosidase